MFSVCQLVTYWCRAIADHLVAKPQLMWEKTLGFKQTQASLSLLSLPHHAGPGARQDMARSRMSLCCIF